MQDYKLVNVEVFGSMVENHPTPDSLGRGLEDGLGNPHPSRKYLNKATSFEVISKGGKRRILIKNAFAHRVEGLLNQYREKGFSKEEIEFLVREIQQETRIHIVKAFTPKAGKGESPREENTKVFHNEGRGGKKQRVVWKLMN